MTSKIGWVALGLAMAAVSACGGGATPPAESPAPSPSPETASSASPSASTFEAQAEEGAKLYADNCASCHGSGGEGGKSAPRLVGMSEGALPLDPPAGAKFRKTQFRTAADVASFVVASMPPGEAGKLTESQYWAILAFDLKANGVTLDHPLDASTASSVVLHP